MQKLLNSQYIFSIPLSQEDNAVGVIQLTRGHRANAFNGAMFELLPQAVRAISSCDTVRCLLICAQGEGPFCSGIDINYLKVWSAGLRAVFLCCFAVILLFSCTTFSRWTSIALASQSRWSCKHWDLLSVSQIWQHFGRWCWTACVVLSLKDAQDAHANTCGRMLCSCKCVLCMLILSAICRMNCSLTSLLPSVDSDNPQESLSLLIRWDDYWKMLDNLRISFCLHSSISTCPYRTKNLCLRQCLAIARASTVNSSILVLALSNCANLGFVHVSLSFVMMSKM